MPQQVLLRHTQRQTVVQYAFQIFLIIVVLIHLIGIEKAGGRQLFGITHHNDVLASGNGPHRLTGGKLRSLIEDNQIKWRVGRINILCHRNGAHQHTGGQPPQQGGDAVEQLTDRQHPSAAANRLLQDAHFR